MSDFPTSFPTAAPTQIDPLIGTIGVSVVLFIIFGTALGAVTDNLLHHFKFPIPYVAFVFFEGVAAAYLLKTYVAGNAIDQVESTQIASILILYVFLPVLLFGEVMNLNWHHIKGGFNQALLLAGPMAFISALLTAVITSVVWGGWRQPVLYYVFGAILCATDPVSVVSLLKSCGASSKLTIVIVGESLLNDGTAMILFFYFFETLEGQTFTPAAIVEFISIKLLASPLCGLTIGLISVFTMKRLYQNWHITDMKIQVGITLVATYSSFFIAQWGTLIDGSGVLSVCSAGCVVAWISSPKILADPVMHEVWGTLEWVCNTLIFLLGGLIAGGNTLENASLSQAGFAVVLYILLMAIRYVLMLMFYPLISTIGVKCSRKDAFFMAFSGIRGALAIALALEVKSNSSVTEENGEQFYFFVCAIAALSLFINGSLAEPVLQYLKLVDDPTQPKSADYLFVLEQVKRRIRRQVREELESMKEELGGFDDQEVGRICRMQRGSTYGGEGDSYQSPIRNTTRISPDLLGYVRSTFLETVRARYWDSIMNGKIGTQSFSAQLLLYSIDKALDLVRDPNSTLGDWECIERNLGPDKTILWMATHLDAIANRFNYFPGLVSYIDAYTERRAIYVLSNFIDGHVYAQNRIHMFLGAPEKGYGDPCPEEASVVHDSEAAVAKAKYLLGMIKQDDLKLFYNQRAARVVLILQQQLIQHMVEEGAINSILADAFLDSIDEDHHDLDRERERTHKKFLKDTTKRKVAEEIERNSESSLRSSLIDDGKSTRNSFFGVARTQSTMSATSDTNANENRGVMLASSSGKIIGNVRPVAPQTPTLRQSLTAVDRPTMEYNEHYVSDTTLGISNMKRI